MIVSETGASIDVSATHETLPCNGFHSTRAIIFFPQLLGLIHSYGIFLRRSFDGPQCIARYVCISTLESPLSLHVDCHEYIAGE